MSKPRNRPKITFNETKESNHPIRARLIEYLNQTLKENKENNENEKSSKMIGLYDDKIFYGRNKLECAMCINEYINDTVKIPYPFDSHARYLESWMDEHGLLDIATMAPLEWEKEIVEKMTTEQLTEFINQYYIPESGSYPNEVLNYRKW